MEGYVCQIPVFLNSCRIYFLRLFCYNDDSETNRCLAEGICSARKLRNILMNTPSVQNTFLKTGKLFWIFCFEAGEHELYFGSLHGIL